MDIEKLLQPISDDSPCGEDLSYDNAMMALETKRLGTPEQQYGDTVIPAQPPEWREVKNDAIALFERTRDLRVAAYLTEAELQMQGIKGFCEGIRLVKEMLSRYWEEAYPLLVDEDGDPDPDYRLNAVNLLAEAQAMDRALRRAPIVESRAAGRFSLADIRVAHGETEAAADPAAPRPDPALIDAAFMDTELETVQAILDAATGAVEDIKAITRQFNDNLGGIQTPDLNRITTTLNEIVPILRGEVAKKGGAVEGEEDEGGASVGGAGGRVVQSAPGQIASRPDVTRALDSIIKYYRDNEPSSPVPVLLERAKSLVNKSFVDILADLTPDGLEQAKVFMAKEPDLGGTSSSNYAAQESSSSSSASASDW
jgi:type VI secretion system protein ImpA